MVWLSIILIFVRDDALVPSCTVILTFNTQKLPTSIKVDYFHCSVQPYIPNPMKLFSVYDHSQKFCCGTAVCGNCVQSGHDAAGYSIAVCINCKGYHAVASQNCPRQVEEKEIQCLKTLEGLSCKEAWQNIESLVPSKQ